MGPHVRHEQRRLHQRILRREPFAGEVQGVPGAGVGLYAGSNADTNTNADTNAHTNTNTNTNANANTNADADADADADAFTGKLQLHRYQCPVCR